MLKQEEHGTLLQHCSDGIGRSKYDGIGSDVALRVYACPPPSTAVDTERGQKHFVPHCAIYVTVTDLQAWQSLGLTHTYKEQS
jgi:hypothetical protein